jgi:hypothetical protein
MLKMKNNKRAGIGQEWMFALSTMFALTVMVLTFNVVYLEHLAPAIIPMLPDDATGVAAEAGIGNFLVLWEFLPYIILGGVVIFLFVISVKKEPVERQW